MRAHKSAFFDCVNTPKAGRVDDGCPAVCSLDIKLRRRRPSGTIKAMGFVRVLTSVVLLALWLPATAQCLLEQALIVEAPDDCCPNSARETSATVEQSANPCCTL